MLQIKNISKKYITGTLTQHALIDVSINLRDNEFVSILGPSGSGKTTLLNIIGGLDHYDTGDLIINGISTKKYKDRDWDSYRNHSIGFVFQSYNLIPHQSILSNVELALTISGISKSERKRKALEALKAVGLLEQAHKKPNQMSGGQMQRVAIARALVNNPDILLADEPTGALDSETSLQVMELLKDVAKDRLVIMVTHNQELAQQYANRIIRIKDGQIIDDSHPFEIEESSSIHKNMGKSSMSFMTSLSLSFNNLWSKKTRTFLTAFAGSIGIIGIALILSLSHGVNQYITDTQKETMTSYPITIDATSINLSGMFTSLGQQSQKKIDHPKDKIYSNGQDLEMYSQINTSVTENNLTAFKKELDDPQSEINQYIGEHGVVYSYETKFDFLTKDPKGEIVNVEETRVVNRNNRPDNPMAQSTTSSRMMGQNNRVQELIPGQKGELVSQMMKDNFEVVEGKWPTSSHEVVLFLDYHHEINLQTLYALGMLPYEDFNKLLDELKENKDYHSKQYTFDYQDFLNREYRMVPMSTYYEQQENGNFKNVRDNKNRQTEFYDKGIVLKVVGIMRPIKNQPFSSFSATIGYTNELTHELIKIADESEVVKEQQKTPEINVLSGVRFKPKDDAIKAADMKKTLSEMKVSEKAATFKQILPSMMADKPQQLQQMMKMNEVQLAAMMDQYLKNLDQKTLLQLYDQMISESSYDENMKNFGYISLEAPSTISIYADSFEAKDHISKSIEHYNERVNEKDRIQYNDFVALLMSSVTNIVNVISYVLIAFVAVSLIVSSIMIGIITYISVLERRKEIGILRAIGASKRNIAGVFNAETFIVGLFAGILGIVISWLLLIPINSVIHQVTENNNINAALPLNAAVILVIISVVLTLIGGFIPARKAAKKDPVEALRSE